jgi:hypothetical protein
MAGRSKAALASSLAPPDAAPVNEHSETLRLNYLNLIPKRLRRRPVTPHSRARLIRVHRRPHWLRVAHVRLVLGVDGRARHGRRVLADLPLAAALARLAVADVGGDAREQALAVLQLLGRVARADLAGHLARLGDDGARAPGGFALADVDGAAGGVLRGALAGCVWEGFSSW